MAGRHRLPEMAPCGHLGYRSHGNSDLAPRWVQGDTYQWEAASALGTFLSSHLVPGLVPQIICRLAVLIYLPLEAPVH